MKFLIINGPNINMLGIRERDIYGTDNYDTLVELIHKTADNCHVSCDIYQSNHEGNIIDKIQEAYFSEVDGIIINPAGYSHTSIAILDALKAVRIPTVEVHLTDISSRESFRQHSYITSVSVRSIVGKGIDGYREAIEWLAEYLKTSRTLENQQNM